MKNTLSFVMREARHRLTRLGLMLFYVYILLALAGVVGFVYGVMSIIMRFIQIGPALHTPWHEIILLTLICAFMIKFFLRESIALTQPDKIKDVSDRDFETPPPEAPRATIIPFKRKQSW